MGWRETVAALLGVSAYAAPPSGLPSLGDDRVERLREALGGQLSPLPTTRTRWFLSDLESAQAAADAGDLSAAAQLYRAMRRDAAYAGLLATRTGGLVRLPRRFYGNPEIIEALQKRNGTRSVFDEMHPPSELKLLADDGVNLGVGVAELLPVDGRDFPVLVRLDPEWLRYRWNENRWYYLSVAGALPVTPGDGRWVLHTPGGRVAPWQSGIWHACGAAFIDKTHARLHEANWEAKLANPARAAVAPVGATEDQRRGFLSRLIAWGVNTVFELPAGWDVKIIESNGRGFESFTATIDRSDREYMIALAGQVVTTDGGVGFANADIHKSIRADLIQGDGDALAHTLNTQTLPAWIASRWGVEALEDGALVEWDVRPPADMAAEAKSYQETAKAIVDLGAALAPYGRDVDVDELASRGGVPAVASRVAAPTVRVELADADAAKVVRVDEARAAQGLGPIGDDRGLLTIAELATGPVAGSPDAMPAGDANGDGAEDAAPAVTAAETLAAKMTALKLRKCEHGSSNRCRLCGIERVRDVAIDATGKPFWLVAWRAIGAKPAAPAPEEAA